jgi:hypothetical protein
MQNLAHTFGELAHTIPTSLNEDFLFSAQTLPAPPLTVISDQLLIWKTYHGYLEYFRADLLCFQAHKPTYRQLAVLLLACVFHAEPSTVTIHLTHPASDIKKIIIESPYETGQPSSNEYRTHPDLFCYAPSEPGYFPWSDHLQLQPSDLPRFLLTNTEDFVVSDEDWKQRDILRGFGTDRATVRFAELLLNMSRPESLLNDCALEGEAGSRGVGRMSAEARLLLPGGNLWKDTLFG